MYGDIAISKSCTKMIPKFASNCSRMRVYGDMASLKLWPKIINKFSLNLSRIRIYRDMAILKLYPKNVWQKSEITLNKDQIISIIPYGSVTLNPKKKFRKNLDPQLLIIFSINKIITVIKILFNLIRILICRL